VDAPDPAVLLAWYDRHRRHLPWRSAPGTRAEPYHVWLSEIMLQQTTVKAVGPYYAIGLCRRPDNELDPKGVELSGTLLDGRGDPIDDGLVEVWDPVGRRWGRCGTADGGRFEFVVPRDATHLEVTVFARGLLNRLFTRIYLPDHEANRSDPLLSSLPDDRAATLVAARDGQRSLRFDVRLQGDGETMFLTYPGHVSPTAGR